MKFKDCNNYLKCDDGYYRYVYVTICTAIENKDDFYIGKHKCRVIQNRYIGSGRIIKQYIKYHPNEYIKLILGTYLTDEECQAAELYFINKYFNDPNCLNIYKVSSSGFTGHKQSEKAINSNRINLQKARDVQSQKPMSEIGRRNISDAMIRRYEETPELKQQISDKIKDLWQTEEHINKMSEIHSSEEYKEKRSKASKKMWEDAEYRQKQADFRKTFRHRQDSKDKISEFSRNARWLTDSYEEHFLRPEYWGEFIDIGFKFGRLKRKKITILYTEIAYQA